MRVPQKGYCLIDFEHGGLADIKPPFQKLQNWDDDTLEKEEIYTRASDMYELGKLKDHLPGITLSKTGMVIYATKIINSA